VELRRDMWALVRRLRDTGVTIILTTHYIEEAEEMAERVGVIHKGELILVEDKQALMAKLGKKQLILHLHTPLPGIPAALAGWDLALNNGGCELELHVRRERGTGLYPGPAAPHGRTGHRVSGPQYTAEFPRGDLRQSGE
jgi:hypothetical protein